ncbi:MAG: hypothetical protein WAW86_08850 [Gammaproteobacteria bacterium]
MLIRFAFFSIVITLLATTIANASVTGRTEQFSNDQVLVWETVIYPGKSEMLKMHRHDHDRVLVAFNSGQLKIINDKGQVHYLKLEKEKSYFLSKNIPNEMHMDENVTDHPIKVLVIELKNS